MKNLKVGYAMCGSFCTLKRAVEEIKVLKEKDFDIYPIMSPITYSTDTRFGKAADFISEVEEICGKKIICTVKDAEPIGPKALLDVLVISPCTGNTLGKIANGITDSSVSMAAKAHLRNGRPLVLTIATNDALSASAKNIGALMNTKNVYFVPFGQDDAFKKPTSLIANFSLIYDTVISALDGNQLQPILLK